MPSALNFLYAGLIFGIAMFGFVMRWLLLSSAESQYGKSIFGVLLIVSMVFMSGSVSWIYLFAESAINDDSTIGNLVVYGPASAFLIIGLCLLIFRYIQNSG